MHAWDLRRRRDVAHSRYRTPPYCLPIGVTPSAPHIPVFAAQCPACIYPCPTLRVQPHDSPRMARGQDGSLRLSCMTLTFTAPRRFLSRRYPPQIGFSRLIVRISSRTSFGTEGRPGLPRPIFQLQNKPKPVRCQPMTVAVLTMKTPDSQPSQTEESHPQTNRSVAVSFGRFTERCRTQT
jgi:hypothetical protein